MLRQAPGFRLPAYAVPADLRGPHVPRLARRCRRNVLDARVIGRAARSAVRDPARWSAFGPTTDVLQLVKYLWHILVLRGTAGDLPSAP